MPTLMNSKVKQALTFAGVESVKDLLTLDGESFSQLTYMAGTNDKRLRILVVVKLKKVSPFHAALCDHEVVFILPGDRWLQTTDTDWKRFCISPGSFSMGKNSNSAYYASCNKS